MIRREFLQTLSAGAAATLPLLRPSAMNEKLHRIGIELYTVRDLLERDFEGTLAALARIGYQEVEFAGLHNRPAQEIRGMLDHLGLTAPSGHAGLAELTDTLDQTIADAAALGHRYVVLSWIPENLRNAVGYAQVAQMLNRAGEKLRAAGLAIGYHNHDFEFEQLESTADLPEEYRRTGYDLLLGQTDPSVVIMELDLFWIRKGRRDPLAYFAEFPGRFHMLHVKDMAADGTMADVGAGIIDWRPIFAAAGRAGVRHYFVEHDEPTDPLASAKASFGYLKRLRFQA